MSSKRKIVIFSAGWADCEETVGYRSGRFYAALILLVGIGFAVVAPETARAATITVNTLADDSTASDGLCSLRKAINNANSASDTTGGDYAAGTGTDTINFSVSGTIKLSSPLPSIISHLTINSRHAIAIDGTACGC
jgi:CSLREA domain-containing protein